MYPPVRLLKRRLRAALRAFLRKQPPRQMQERRFLPVVERRHHLGHAPHAIAVAVDETTRDHGLA